MLDENCIFCRIIKGEIPSLKVYEDDKVLAFLDISPVNKGHILVIPKNHASNYLESDDKDISACAVAVKKIGKAVVRAVEADGFNIGVNTKKAAGQIVMHTHLHIIPRFNDDGFRHWPHKQYEEGEMEKYKEKIIKEIGE